MATDHAPVQLIEGDGCCSNIITIRPLSTSAFQEKLPKLWTDIELHRTEQILPKSVAEGNSVQIGGTLKKYRLHLINRLTKWLLGM
jgi:hypothetical protein